MSHTLEAVLVLGSAGFVGSAICTRLNSIGHKVFALGRSEMGRSADGITHMRGSIEDRELLREALQQCQTVIYAASLTTPSTSARDPALEVTGNLLALARLLECAPDFPGRRLIYLSSGGAIYGDCAGNAREEDLLRPRSYYGAGKAAAEALLHACAASTDWTTISLRPTNLYGPMQQVTKGFAIVPTLFDRALDGRAFNVWGDGSIVRDYCYIDDMVDAVLVTLATSPSEQLAVYNVASGHAISILELVDLCQQVSGRPIRVEHLPRRGVDVARIAPSNHAIISDLGWSPRTDMLTGLAHTWQWRLQQEQLA